MNAVKNAQVKAIGLGLLSFGVVYLAGGIFVGEGEERGLIATIVMMTYWLVPGLVTGYLSAERPIQNGLWLALMLVAWWSVTPLLFMGKDLPLDAYLVFVITFRTVPEVVAATALGYLLSQHRNRGARA